LFFQVLSETLSQFGLDRIGMKMAWLIPAWLVQSIASQPGRWHSCLMPSREDGMESIESVTAPIGGREFPDGIRGD